jgi:hypothetical protein
MIEHITPAQFRAIKPKKPSKYRAVKTVVDGITFDSKLEATRYAHLLTLQRCGQISELELQPKFSIDVNGIHICNYFADFMYKKDGVYITEDVKSPASRTPQYRLKIKLVNALYPSAKIVEILS